MCSADCWTCCRPIECSNGLQWMHLLCLQVSSDCLKHLYHAEVTLYYIYRCVCITTTYVCKTYMRNVAFYHSVDGVLFAFCSCQMFTCYKGIKYSIAYCYLCFFLSLRHRLPAAEAICFRVVRPCRCPSVRLSVTHVVVLCFHDISSICWRIFAKLLSLMHLGTEMNWFWFWGQKVKVQGHGMTECVQDSHVSTISPVSIDRFSPNFCHWCILGHRWPDYVFGSKGQSSRSHHRGRGAQHSMLPSSATFSSLSLKLWEPWILISSDVILCTGPATYSWDTLLGWLFHTNVDIRSWRALPASSQLVIAWLSDVWRYRAQHFHGNTCPNVPVSAHHERIGC